MFRIYGARYWMYQYVQMQLDCGGGGGGRKILRIVYLQIYTASYRRSLGHLALIFFNKAKKTKKEKKKTAVYSKKCVEQLHGKESCRIFLSFSGRSPHFMEIASSLPCSKQPATCPYYEPGKISAHPSIPFL